MTSLASTSIFMEPSLSSRKDNADQLHRQQYADETGQDAAHDIGQGEPPTSVPDELERLPLEGGKGRVAAAETGADQEIPALVLWRQTLQDDDRGRRQDEGAAHI